MTTIPSNDDHLFEQLNQRYYTCRNKKTEKVLGEISLVHCLIYNETQIRL